MNSKDQYVHMMQKKLDEWSAEVDVLGAKAGRVALQVTGKSINRNDP